MDKKELKKRAIDIKGKEYILVKDRILFFNENYKNGSIQTLVNVIDNVVYAKTTVIPDVANRDRKFTGNSQAEIGKGHLGSVALEVAETSSVGRALAMLGIGIIDSIASADEMNKSNARSTKAPKKDTKPSEKQMKFLASLAKKSVSELRKNGYTGWQVSAMIDKLVGKTDKPTLATIGSKNSEPTPEQLLEQMDKN